MLYFSTKENNWKPYELSEYVIEKCLDEARRCEYIEKEYFAIFQIEPYIDSIYIEFDNRKLNIIKKIKRFTFKEDYVWDGRKELFWIQNCLNNKKCVYNSKTINEIYKKYLKEKPYWNLKRYYTRDLRVLDHIYNCMRKNTPKELLYKAGIDELAANIEIMDDIDLLSTTPSQLYNEINIKTLRALNCEQGAILLSTSKNREYIKKLEKYFEKIFVEKLNNAQCQYIQILIDYNLTFKEVGRLFLAAKRRLSRMWNCTQVALFVNSQKENYYIKEIYGRIQEMDPIYKKYLKGYLNIFLNQKISMNELYELNNYLFIEKDKLNKAIRRANRQRNDEWQERDNGYFVRYPQTVNDFCRETVYMGNCLLGYFDSMIHGETTILFMRKCDDVNKPFITMEIYENQLMQAYHKANRECTKDEQEWIVAYCKRHGIDYKEFF